MHMVNQKHIVSTLCAAGLALGLVTGAVVAPTVIAQDSQQFQPHEIASQLFRAFKSDKNGEDYVVAGVSREDGEAMRAEAYNEFTQALADELGINNPDEVDAAIRAAMIAVVDANDGLSRETREEQKDLIRNADAPIGPAYRGFGG